MSLHTLCPTSVPLPSHTVPRRPSPSNDPHHRFSSRSNSHTSLLGPVLEDESDQSCGSRSARRVLSPVGGSATMSRGNSVEEIAEWMVDVTAVQEGRGKWLERERVILVLGECPSGALEPIISNPLFANSLLLSSTPVHPINPYPTVHRLSSTDVEDVVDEATAISTAYRKRNRKMFRAKLPSSTSSSPFDAILHFLPSPVRYEPTLALQRMLRESIMATTVATAALASFTHSSRPAKSSRSNIPALDLPIPLIHVIPSGSPGALPVVIERYLLQLLPTLAAEPSSRVIRALVLSSSAWQTRSIPFASHIPTVDAMLLGGLDPVPGQSRVYVSSWNRIAASTSILAFPVSPSWNHHVEMDRRGSATSSLSSSGQHEAVTPSGGSYVDMAETIRPGSIPPSRLSFVETFENEDEELPETVGRKASRSLFGWRRRKE